MSFSSRKMIRMSQVFRDGLLHFYERWAKDVTGKETYMYDDLAFKLSVSFEDFLEKRNGSAVLISENEVVCSNSILLTLLKLKVMFWRWDYCAIPCPNMQQLIPCRICLCCRKFLSIEYISQAGCNLCRRLAQLLLAMVVLLARYFLFNLRLVCACVIYHSLSMFVVIWCKCDHVICAWHMIIFVVQLF